MREGAGEMTGLSSEQKRALLVELLAREGLAAQQPLSYGQRALWFVYRLDPSSPAYNVAALLRIESEVDVPALRRALQMCVDRHPMLRTTFKMIDGEPVQRIHAQMDAAFDRTDASSWTQADIDSALRADANRPFDLESQPGVRMRLVTVGPAEHILQLTFHHIVYDLRSGMQITRELPVLYEAARLGQPSPLPPPEASYADYVRWQRKSIEGAEGDRLLNYWRDTLSGLPVLDLPTDRERPALQTYAGSSYDFQLSSKLSAKVRAFAKEHATTPYNVLLSAYAVFLQRHTMQDDIVIGSPGLGRSRAEFDSVVGYFVNPLVIRLAVAPQSSFAALVGSVRETVLAAIDHGDYPFPLLVEHLQPARDPSRSPLFQVAFTWNKLGWLAEPERANGEHALRLRDIGGGQQGANFDLELAISERGDELGGWWRYNTDLFLTGSIEEFSRQFLTLVDAAVTRPETRVSQLPLVSPEERDLLARAWNPTERISAPAGATLTEWFERQVARTPAAAAVTFEGRTLTYDELNGAANRLAHVLRSKGVAPGCRVGIYLDRSLSLVVGILGTLKAGGAYVPIDPTYPPDRVRYIVEDAAVRAVVTQTSLLSSLDTAAFEAVVIGDDQLTASDQNSSNPAVGVTAEDLAYVIYTSGSTGRPKGVGVTHANATRLFAATNDWFGFNENDVWTLFHSAAFDFSVWELWGALLYGGRLVVVPYWIARSPESFRALLADERVTVLNQTPSAFRQLIEADERCGSLPLALRYVVFGGEALEMRMLRPWVERHGAESPRLINMYGITETTVHVTYRPLTAADVLHGARSVIGAPIPDLELYLLDPDLQPVPVGMRGELFVGGSGVAEGYLGRPRLTAERFIPDEWSGRSGARIYRSGDLGRRLPGGDVEYLGRIDQQVKIRGFRIELGEIEQALCRHAGVRDAIVTADKDSDGDVRLSAFVVPDPAAAAPLRTLMAWEREGRDVGSRCELPNGMAVFQLNRSETDFLYEEIFAGERYLRNGITLGPNPCIFDVGANIGMFSLYVAQQCLNPTIFAFEPIPAVSEVLRMNAELHGLNLRPLTYGLSSQEGEATFVYYPNVSVLSGQFGDLERERTVVGAFLQNQVDAARPDLLDELLNNRLSTESVRCTLTTVSAMIKAHGVERIDLLKVDVEKGELAVLEGVDAADWPKIDQVLVEVHDEDGRLDQVVSLLRSRGFDTVVEQDAPLAGTGLHNVYAVRGDSRREESAKPTRKWSSAEGLIADLRRDLAQALPGYMVPGSIVLMDALPLTSNGKLDRRALPAATTSRRSVVEPRTPLEHEIAEIFRGVLRVEHVGVTDDFFELGGHSLLATKVISRVRAATAVDLPLRILFESPTVEGLATAVVQQQISAFDAETLGKALADVEAMTNSERGAE